MIRPTALMLLLSVFLSELSFAAPSEKPAAAVSLRPLERLVRDPQEFQAPLDFCTLKEVSKGSSDKLIIHIQDAHANLSGQQNLARTLESIIRQYGISLVLVEGGSPAEGSLEPLKKIGPAGSAERAAKRLLAEGRLSGEEYLQLTSRHRMTLRGVENMTLYRNSVESYARLAEKRQKALDYLKTVRFAVGKLKAKFYPASLLDYENRKKAEGGSGIGRLVEFADENSIDLGEFQNIAELRPLLASEKTIDFSLANLEQAALLDQLHRRGAGEDIRGQLEKFNQAKNSKVSQYTLFRNILNIADKKGVSLAGYPNLLKYGAYLKKFQEIDLDLLLEESENAEDLVYRSALRSQDALMIRAIDRYTALLETAYRIQMSSKDFNFFRANEPDFSTAGYLAFINRKLAEQDYFSDLLVYDPCIEEGEKALADFYASVDRRDAAFLENAKGILKEEGRSAAVLITGGYHSQHLKKLFRDNDYSYIVLAPIVTSETNQQKYEDLLLGEKKGSKRIEAGESDIMSFRHNDGVRTLRAASSGPRWISRYAGVAGVPASDAAVRRVRSDFAKRVWVTEGSPFRTVTKDRRAVSASKPEDAGKGDLFKESDGHFPDLERPVIFYGSGPESNPLFRFTGIKSGYPDKFLTNGFFSQNGPLFAQWRFETLRSSFAKMGARFAAEQTARPAAGWPLAASPETVGAVRMILETPAVAEGLKKKEFNYPLYQREIEKFKNYHNVDIEQTAALVAILTLYIARIGNDPNNYQAVIGELGKSEGPLKVLFLRAHGFAFGAWAPFMKPNIYTNQYEGQEVRILQTAASAISADLAQASLPAAYLQSWAPGKTMRDRDKVLISLNDWIFPAGVIISNREINRGFYRDAEPRVRVAANSADVTVKKRGSLTVRKIKVYLGYGAPEPPGHLALHLLGTNIIASRMENLINHARDMHRLTYAPIPDLSLYRMRYPSVADELMRFDQVHRKAVSRELSALSQDQTTQLLIEMQDDHEEYHVYAVQLGIEQKLLHDKDSELFPQLGELAKGRAPYLTLAGLSIVSAYGALKPEGTVIENRRSLDSIYNGALRLGYLKDGAKPIFSEREINPGTVILMNAEQLDALISLSKEELKELATKLLKELFGIDALPDDSEVIARPLQEMISAPGPVYAVTPSLQGNQPIPLDEKQGSRLAEDDSAFMKSLRGLLADGNFIAAVLRSGSERKRFLSWVSQNAERQGTWSDIVEIGRLRSLLGKEDEPRAALLDDIRTTAAMHTFAVFTSQGGARYEMRTSDNFDRGERRLLYPMIEQFIASHPASVRIEDIGISTGAKPVQLARFLDSKSLASKVFFTGTDYLTEPRLVRVGAGRETVEGLFNASGQLVWTRFWSPEHRHFISRRVKTPQDSKFTSAEQLKLEYGAGRYVILPRYLPAYLEECRRLLSAADFIEEDVTKASPDRTADLVLVNNVYIHLDSGERRAALLSIFNRLNPAGGRAVFMESGRRSIRKGGVESGVAVYEIYERKGSTVTRIKSHSRAEELAELISKDMLLSHHRDSWAPRADLAGRDAAFDAELDELLPRGWNLPGRDIMPEVIELDDPEIREISPEEVKLKTRADQATEMTRETIAREGTRSWTKSWIETIEGWIEIYESRPVASPNTAEYLALFQDRLAVLRAHRTELERRAAQIPADEPSLFIALNTSPGGRQLTAEELNKILGLFRDSPVIADTGSIKLRMSFEGIPPVTDAQLDLISAFLTAQKNGARLAERFMTLDSGSPENQKYIPTIISFVSQFLKVAEKDKDDRTGELIYHLHVTDSEAADLSGMMAKIKNMNTVDAGIYLMMQAYRSLYFDVLKGKDDMMNTETRAVLEDSPGAYGTDPERPVLFDLTPERQIVAVYLPVEGNTFVKLEIVRGTGSDERTMDAETTKLSPLLNAKGQPMHVFRARSSIVNGVTLGAHETEGARFAKADLEAERFLNDPANSYVRSLYTEYKSRGVPGIDNWVYRAAAAATEGQRHEVVGELISAKRIEKEYPDAELIGIGLGIGAYEADIVFEVKGTKPHLLVIESKYDRTPHFRSTFERTTNYQMKPLAEKLIMVEDLLGLPVRYAVMGAGPKILILESGRDFDRFESAGRTDVNFTYEDQQAGRRPGKTVLRTIPVDLILLNVDAKKLPDAETPQVRIYDSTSIRADFFRTIGGHFIPSAGQRRLVRPEILPAVLEEAFQREIEIEREWTRIEPYLERLVRSVRQPGAVKGLVEGDIELFREGARFFLTEGLRRGRTFDDLRHVISDRLSAKGGVKNIYEPFKKAGERNRPAEGARLAAEDKELFVKKLEFTPGLHTLLIDKRRESVRQAIREAKLKWAKEQHSAQPDPVLLDQLKNVEVNDPELGNIKIGISGEESLLNERLDFLLQELLMNAFDAYARTGGRGGEIELRVAEAGGEIRIEISDSGIGVSNITDKPGEFKVTANPSVKDAYLTGGAGAGLLWSKVVAQARNGDLTVFSPGRGDFKTTVRMSFPKDEISADYISSAARLASAQDPQRLRRIYAIDEPLPDEAVSKFSDAAPIMDLIALIAAHHENSNRGNIPVQAASTAFAGLEILPETAGGIPVRLADPRAAGKYLDTVVVTREAARLAASRLAASRALDVKLPELWHENQPAREAAADYKSRDSRTAQLLRQLVKNLKATQHVILFMSVEGQDEELLKQEIAELRSELEALNQKRQTGRLEVSIRLADAAGTQIEGALWQTGGFDETKAEKKAFSGALRQSLIDRAVKTQSAYLPADEAHYDREKGYYNAIPYKPDMRAAIAAVVDEELAARMLSVLTGQDMSLPGNMTLIREPHRYAGPVTTDTYRAKQLIVRALARISDELRRDYLSLRASAIAA